MNRVINRLRVLPRNQNGIALVELVIAIPAMLVLMFITAEVTRVMYQYNTLNKLVRDGSRSISSQLLKATFLSSDELQSARQLIITGKPQGGPALLEGLTEDDITITLSTLGAGGTQRYYVDVFAEFDYVPLFSSIDGTGFLPQSVQFDFTLTALSSMRAR